MKKLFDFIKSYLNLNGAVDEAIVIVTVVFVSAMYLTFHYVFLKQDMPAGIESFLKFIWGGSVGIYIAKAISNIFKGGGNA